MILVIFVMTNVPFQAAQCTYASKPAVCTMLPLRNPGLMHLKTILQRTDF